MIWMIREYMLDHVEALGGKIEEKKHDSLVVFFPESMPRERIVECVVLTFQAVDMNIDGYEVEEAEGGTRFSVHPD